MSRDDHYCWSHLNIWAAYAYVFFSFLYVWWTNMYEITSYLYVYLHLISFFFSVSGIHTT